MKTLLAAGALALLLATGSPLVAQTFEFDLLGIGGPGLLPENNNPPYSSGASGSEVGGGITFDTLTNTLSIEFEFQGLTGSGLIDAAGGIHIHDAGAMNPLGSDGPIEFFLNSGAANVAFGSTSGAIDIDVVLSPAQASKLFESHYYINIHSGGAPSGELRANLVPAVPEPSAGVVALIGTIGCLMWRLRGCRSS